MWAQLSVGGGGWRVVAGVPMVAWPLYAERHLNMNVLVKDMKMAFNLQRDDDGFVSEDELERRVRGSMDSSEVGEVGKETEVYDAFSGE